MARRDELWSVPENLPGEGPWKGRADRILDHLEPSEEADRWDGLPLVAAWTCSSLLEGRRIRARIQLALWGSRRLSDMGRLLEHMATVDDPQIIEDLAVAALGAAIGAAPRDPDLVSLANVVDGLFFADRASSWTPDALVRAAARALVERAALFFPEEMSDALKRARPPCQKRGGKWPKFTIAELKSPGRRGSIILDLDLHYVAERCFTEFAREASPARAAQEGLRLSDVPEGIRKAVVAGAIPVDKAIAERCLQSLQLVERPSPSQESLQDRLEALKARFRDENGAGAPMPSDHELVRRAVKAWCRSDRPASHSDEYDALLAHARGKSGLSEVSYAGIRDAMIDYQVGKWGWTKKTHGWTKHDEPVRTIDHAIFKQNRQATQGARSPVASTREKYVWAAVNLVAGQLADRMPVWDEGTGQWGSVRDFSDVCTGMPDPLPRTEPDGDQGEPEPWAPECLFIHPFPGEPSLASRAARWLSEAPLPDPAALVQGAIGDWRDGLILAADVLRTGHDSCIDQRLWVAAIGCARGTAKLWKRDAPHLGSVADLSDAHVGIGSSTYLPPSLASWAHWLHCEGEDCGYVSLSAKGRPIAVRGTPLAARLLARDEETSGAEFHAMSLAPKLRVALGQVALKGGVVSRHYLNRKGEVVALEQSEPPAEVGYIHHYLAIERSRFLHACRIQNLVPMWAVRVWREASPALWLAKGKLKVPAGLLHRNRDTRWLVFWNGATRSLESVLVKDTLEPWERKPVSDPSQEAQASGSKARQG